MSTRTNVLIGMGWWLAIAASAALSLLLAHRQSMEEEVGRAERLAAEILERAQALGRQTAIAEQRIGRAGIADACSDAGRALLYQIVLETSKLQAVGIERDGLVACSSLGAPLEGTWLGPVDYVSNGGADVRLQIPLGREDSPPTLAFARNGVFALVHGDTMADLLGEGPDVSAALISPSANRVLVFHGEFEPEWSDKLQRRGDRFFDGRHLVVAKRSVEFDVAATVAVGKDVLSGRLYRTIMLVLPLGLALGVAVALLLQRLLRRRGSLPAVLRSALERGEFELHYQPIVALADGSLVGCEALLRWPRKDRPGLPPASFLPIAESCGLMRALTRYVIDCVARDARTLIARHPDAYVSLNLGPADLHDHEVMTALLALPARSGLPARHFLVEVTEQSFVDPELARRGLEQIRALGMRVAIDDFGTGFSGLSRLGDMPSDYLKIDRSFVEAIGTDSPTREVALHIIGMADALGLTSIGEGIETRDQAEFLRAHGVRFGQGWLYGRAQPMALLLRDSQRLPAVPAP